jgi:hypothetical protein
MAWNLSLPEHCKLVSATPLGAQSTANAITLRPISMKNCIKVWLVAVFQQDVADPTTIQVNAGASVTTAVTAITFLTPWWLNANVAATDTLVRQADLTIATLANVATDQMAVIEIDPADVLAQNVTFDCLSGTISGTQQATNLVGAIWVVQERFGQSTPPTAITN